MNRRRFFVAKPPLRPVCLPGGSDCAAAAVFLVLFATGGLVTAVLSPRESAVLVFVSHIFAGLTSLHVAAVGHLTAIVTAAALGFLVAVSRRVVKARPDGNMPVPGSATQQPGASAGTR